MLTVCYTSEVRQRSLAKDFLKFYQFAVQPAADIGWHSAWHSIIEYTIYRSDTSLSENALRRRVREEFHFIRIGDYHLGARLDELVQSGVLDSSRSGYSLTKQGRAEVEKRRASNLETVRNFIEQVCAEIQRQGLLLAAPDK